MTEMDVVSECLTESALDERYEGLIGFGFGIESIFQACKKLDYELNVAAGHIVGYVIIVAVTVLAGVERKLSSLFSALPA